MSGKTVVREVKVEEAVGLPLAHDLTQIVPGEFKGRLFKKGHVIREEDIPALLRIGKEHVYVLHLAEDDLHEDDAALRMAKAAAGTNVRLTEPSEGKVMLKAAVPGLAKIAKSFVDEVNAIESIALATLPDNTPVRPDQSLAGTRAIPLFVPASTVERVERLAERWSEANGGERPIRVKPYRRLRVGVVTTGGEVYKGLVEDKFGPVVKAKVEQFGSTVIGQRICPDDTERIVEAIRHFVDEGADMILVTGGMSVDPDDRTPGAIRAAGARVVSQGTPMLPGSMLMVAYLGEIPVLGLPGSVMHDKYTAFDVLLPRICAGETIERSDITAMGYGGLFAGRA